jgi:hypothetical protein
MYAEDPTPAAPIRQMIARAKTLPYFLAHRLEQFQEREDVSDETLAGLLGCLVADLDFLRLCRAPKDRAEVARIADRIGCDPMVLAEMLGIIEF